MPRSVVATDNFNRASLGANWAQLRPFDGSIEIDSSTRLGANSLGAGRWVGAGTFTADQYAVLKLTTLGFGGGERIGVIVRASGDIDTNRDYYSFLDNNTGAVAQLIKTVNGTETILDSRSSPFAAGDTIELEVEGTTLRAFRNGTLIYSLTDSSLSTGNPGALNEQTGNVFGDDWEGGNITTVQLGEPALFGGQTIYRLPAQRWG